MGNPRSLIEGAAVRFLMPLSSLGKLRVGDGQPARVMGVINLSPESFYRASVRETPEEAARAAEEMVER